MRVIATIAAPVLFSFIFVNNVLACQCLEYAVPACEQLSRAAAVFVGTVKSIKHDDPSNPDSGAGIIHFDVEQTVKGSVGPTVDVIYLFGSSCSWNKFEVGQRWVVYGHRKTVDEMLRIPFCTGSFPLSGPFEKVFYLNDFKDGKTKEAIRGRILSYGDGELEGASIEALNGNLSFTGRSDGNGLYEISVARPGKYKVKVSIPFAASLSSPSSEFSLLDHSVEASKSTWTYEAKVDKGLCNYRQLDFEKLQPKPKS